MRLGRALGIALLIAASGVGGWLAGSGRLLPLFQAAGIGGLVPTPHEQYARRLRAAGLADTPLGRRWLAAAERSGAGVPVDLPRREAIWFPASEPHAAVFRSTLRRGQQTSVSATIESAAPIRVFIDLFERRADGELHAVAHAPADARSLDHDVDRDAEYVLRIQPELLQDARVEIEWRVGPTLALPVEGATRRSIQSYFRAPRDGGAREHQGVDIFASRGTPVVAAADGIVTSVGTNRLGGKVVWVSRPFRRETFYYAHLDTQAATAGSRVRAGEVLGTVGSTGNAAGGPPHLHFGIYTGSGAVDPLPYLEPAAEAPPLTVVSPLGERRRLRRAFRLAGRALPAGTIVEVVGAGPDGPRLRLPDGTEGYATPAVLGDVTTRLRALRVAPGTRIVHAAVGGVTIERLEDAQMVDILGSFDDAVLARTATGRVGWITGAGA